MPGKPLHINVKHPPGCQPPARVGGGGGVGRQFHLSLSTVEPPFPSPTHQATCAPPSLGVGWLGQESVHSPGAVTDSSGGLRGRGMCTKLPLPLLGIFIGAFETCSSQAIAGLSHLSSFPGTGVTPICAQSLGIAGPLETPSRSQWPPLAPKEIEASFVPTNADSSAIQASGKSSP